jgi:MGT family glycosyltransferase
MATFLAYTSPAAGHLFPLVPGLLALQARGHRVHVRTDPGLVEAARAAGLAAEALDERVTSIEIRDFEEATGGGRLRKGLAGLMSRGPAEREDLGRAAAETGADALLIDTNAYGAAVGAQASGLPWATTLPSLLPLPGRGIPPYGLGMKPLRGPLGRVRDVVLFKVVERAYARAMLPRLNAMRADAGLPALRSPLEHVLAPDRVLALTGEPLEYPRHDLHPKVRFVGAQNWDPPTPPARPPAWLAEPGDPWVLVTCSTDYQRDDALAAAAIEALRDEPVRVVITLADAYGQAELPAAPNVRLERFVSHAAVIERAVAVVCHSGMGIVQKAAGAGVPIVAVPFGRDQPEVARRVSEAGAGVRLPAKELTPERLRAAVREAVAMRPSAEAAGARLRAAGGPERFADAAEELLAATAAARTRTARSPRRAA